MWLIGSFAKDKSHEKSDIDFLIEYNESEMSSSNLDAWANSINSLERHFNREVQFIPSDRFPEMDLDKEAIKIK
ncbi:MAG: nucleotidyltransferase domain-containing protein [Bacteroidia bacterium]